MTARRLLLRVLLASLALSGVLQADDAAALPEVSYAAAIEAAAPRVVKLYGAGVGRTRGYASGVLVSSDGRIVTALSSLLEGEQSRAVLADGRRFPAQVLCRDEMRQLALLKIDAENLPFFALSEGVEALTGDWALVAGNWFKIADGPEPVSVALGVVSGRAPLDARRRAQEVDYRGDVLLIDVITSTPGSPGGAVVDLQGQLLGVVGKELESRRTNTLINYAFPVSEISAFVRACESGQPQQEQAGSRPAPPRLVADLGIRLFDIGGRLRPAYIERIRPGSPAERAGLRGDDLVLQLNGREIGTCDDVAAALAEASGSAPLIWLVKRGDELLTISLTPATEGPQ